MALRDDICQAMEEYMMSAPAWSMVSAGELSHSLGVKEQLFLLDVREPSEYEDGRIAGAVNIPAGQLAGRVGELPRDRAVRIVAYCATGRRSAYATMLLRVHGYDDVRTLAGGIRAWTAAGYPVEG